MSTPTTDSKSPSKLHSIIRKALNERDGTWRETNAKADLIAEEILASDWHAERARLEAEVAKLTAVVAEVALDAHGGIDEGRANGEWGSGVISQAEDTLAIITEAGLSTGQPAANSAEGTR